MSTSTAHNKHTNRLSRETSPYLLQHQHNPVDWYPWGPEAFERARREDKPIFLSVGYSTCYWCHVMERQSFENEAVAAVMNEKFVNIKVDREERPDVDQLYMTAVQVLTRHGGWPMSVWLTPDLRPFYGGTYYPPTDMHGRPGFVTLLHALEDAYRNRKSDVHKTADQLVNILKQMAGPGKPDGEIRIDDGFIEDQIGRSVSDYDPTFGGFGGAPKFPRETLLELLLVYLRDERQAEVSDFKIEVRKRVLHTLDALAAGGIRDQLGGGFHRYSTDARWLIPHFEIMLYDNAMLAWCYAEAYRQTGETRYANVARSVCDFVLREMTSPDTGAFYTALDAEVDGQEGLNYLWTPEEIESILGEGDAKVFNKAYGVNRGPNFADPHHGSGTPDKNILYLPTPRETEALDAQLAPMRAKLKAARDRRKQPLLDTKILTSWNALMIRALAFAGEALSEPRYVQAAARAADFLLTHHRTPAGGLYRTSRDGQAKYDGFLDDYAYLAEALLALDRRRQAEEVAGLMVERFGDSGAFYFTDRSAKDLLVRQQVAGDSPLPSGNAVAAMTLLKLGDAPRARAVIAAFAQQLEHNGESMSAMVQAALLYLRTTGEPFTVSGDKVGSKVERPLSPQQTAENVVRVSAEWASEKELAVRLSILRGFHVNSHDVSGDSLVATKVSVEGARSSDVIYPPGEEQTFPFADAPTRVYSGDVTIRVSFAQPVKSEFSIGLTYQACDESACLPPVTRRLAVPIL